MAAPQQHIRVVAILTLVAGVLALVPAVLALLVGMGMMAGGAFSNYPGGLWMAGGIMGIIATVMALLGLPGIIAGYGLLARRAWARPLTLVLAILHLFAFPFGTALSIYQFWVLFINQDTVRAYQAESAGHGMYSGA